MATAVPYKDLSDDDKKLVAAGARAYGVRVDEIHAARVESGVTTIVTIGGWKVTYKEGDRVKPLHPLRCGRSIKPPEPPKAEE